MQKILEDFVDEIKHLQRGSERGNERVLSLLMFSKRMMVLTKEKIQLLLKDSGLQGQEDYQDVLDKRYLTIYSFS